MVDSANKRGSEIGTAGAGGPLPIADGVLSTADLAQTMGHYRLFDEEDTATTIGGGPLTAAVLIAIDRRRRRCM